MAAACCVVLMLALPTRADAQQDRPVRIDGDLVIRVGPSGTMTADVRAQQIESRLSLLVQRSTGTLTTSIGPAEAKSGRDIALGGMDVMTVTAEDAAANGETVDRLAAAWADTIRDAVQKARDRRTSAWHRFGAQVRGSVRAALARLLESVADLLPRLFAALVVLGLVWGLATVVRRAARASVPHMVRDRTMQNLLREVAYYAVWLIGLLVALDALGLNPQTFVTGLGLTGVAVGFALKDILSNLVSGILLQALRPFELGDEIVVGPTEGRVEAIELRATHIRDYDGRLVLVPNGEVFTSRVTNNTASPVRRGSVELYTSYSIDFTRAMSVAREAAQATKGVAATPPASARLRELSGGNAIMQVRFWTDSRRSDFVGTSCAVRIAVVLALRDAGIALPEPHLRLLTPRNVDAWRAVFSAGASRGVDASAQET